MSRGAPAYHVKVGLREKKAARTHAHIRDVALALFLDRGYDETTMEEIAERAEVGTSTLYRYFPAKDQILLGSVDDHLGGLATYLRARPADEPLPVALGNAIRDAAETRPVNDSQLLAIRTIVDRAAAPRARLWDILAKEREELEREIAARLGRQPDDVHVVLTARTALNIMEVASDRWRASDHRTSIAELAESIMTELGATGVVLPAARG